MRPVGVSVGVEIGVENGVLNCTILNDGVGRGNFLSCPNFTSICVQFLLTSASMQKSAAKSLRFKIVCPTDYFLI